MSEEPMHQMPTVTASKIAEKGITLDREVKFLVNKARIAKRKADDEAAAAKAAKDKADAAAAAKKKKKEAEKAANDTEEGDGKHRMTLLFLFYSMPMAFCLDVRKKTKAKKPQNSRKKTQ